MKYKEMCEQIIEAVGGRENITDAFHCITRLRLTLKDQTLMDKDKLEKIPGVLKVNIFQTQIQIVIGSEVGEVYDQFCDLTGIAKKEMIDDTPTQNNKKDKKLITRLTEAISQIMMPLIPALIGFSLIKGIGILLDGLGIVVKGTPTFMYLYFLGDAVIYFFPVMVAYSASRYLKTNTILSIIMAAALVSPTIMSLLATEGGATIFNFIPLKNVTYSSTVVPALLMVIFQMYVERILDRVVPKILKSTFVPLLTVFIVMTFTFVIIGPVGVLIGDGLASIYTTLYSIFPPLAGALVGGLWSLMVSWGMHSAFMPIVLNNVAKLGFDTLMPFASCGNFGQLGALYGTFFKAKNKKVKENAASIILTNAVTGFDLSEPVIYGNNLVLKIPFIAGLIGGACGGVVASLFHATSLSNGSFSLFKIPLYADNLLGILAAVAVAFAVGFIITYIKGFDETEGENE